MIALYIILIAIGIAGIVAGIYARKKIAECETEEEKKTVKTNLQLVWLLIEFTSLMARKIMIIKGKNKNKN